MRPQAVGWIVVALGVGIAVSGLDLGRIALVTGGSAAAAVGCFLLRPVEEGRAARWVAAVGYAVLFAVASLPELRVEWAATMAAVLGLVLWKLASGRGGWLALAVVMGAVAARSGNQEYGVDGLVQWLGQFGLEPLDVRPWLAVARKAVHIGFFGLLGLAAVRSWPRTGPPRFGAAWALGWAGLHAGLDEARQSFSPMRTGTPWDVALDLAAAALTISWFAPRADVSAPEASTSNGA